MESNIFRKKSMDRVSSPEQLNDYIKVSNPTVWMILIAIIIFLVGVCAWVYFGRLETTVSTSGEVLNGTYLAYVKEDNILEIKEGLEVRIDGNSYQVETIGKVPAQAGGVIDDYQMVRCQYSWILYYIADEYEKEFANKYDYSVEFDYGDGDEGLA